MATLRKRSSTAKASAQEGGDVSLNARLTSFLLGTRSFDSVPWDTFRRFFPEELRSSPEVRRVHALLAAQRKELRQRVKANIDSSFPRTAAPGPSAVLASGRALPISIAQATALLERREAELASELETVEREAKRLRRVADTQDRELAALQVGRPAAITIPDLEALLQLLEKQRRR